MKRIDQRVESMTLGGLEDMSVPPRQNLVYESREDRMMSMTLHSGAFSIALCKDLRMNMSVSARMAVEFARRYPDRDVWYVNTYAGLGLLKTRLRAAIGTDSLRTGAIPNLRVMTVPSGTWRTSVLTDDIEYNGRADAPPVIILNSFEFAAMSRGQGHRVARELLKLQSDFAATVVVFSHEINREIEAGVAGGGPLGTIAAHATTLFHLFNMFGDNQLAEADEAYEAASVHERSARSDNKIIISPIVVEAAAADSVVGQRTEWTERTVQNAEVQGRDTSDELTVEQEREIEEEIAQIYHKPQSQAPLSGYPVHRTNGALTRGEREMAMA